MLPCLYSYLKPVHVEAAEFLSEVTSEEGAQYLQEGRERLNLPGFVAAYAESAYFRDVMRVVEAPEVLQEIFVQVGPRQGGFCSGERSYEKDE